MTFLRDNINKEVLKRRINYNNTKKTNKTLSRANSDENSPQSLFSKSSTPSYVKSQRHNKKIS